MSISEKLLEKYRYVLVEDTEWHDFLLQEFKDALTIAGFVNIDISYRGFWSQGDGLSFTGTFNCNYIENDKLQNIADESVKDFISYVQHKHCYFSLVRYGYYYVYENTDVHENTVIVASELHWEAEEALQNLCRAIMKSMYNSLELEYDYLASDAVVTEYLIDNTITE